LYVFYWFYKNWSLEQNRTKQKISPFWRTVFAPLFCFELFDRMFKVAAKDSFTRMPYPSLLPASLFFVLNLCGFLPLPFRHLVLLLFVPLTMVQLAVVRVNRLHAPQSDANDNVSIANVVVIGLGSLTLILAFIRTFIQKP